jgi:hypothetical protein
MNLDNLASQEKDFEFVLVSWHFLMVLKGLRASLGLKVIGEPVIVSEIWSGIE